MYQLWKNFDFVCVCVCVVRKGDDKVKILQIVRFVVCLNSNNQFYPFTDTINI